MAIIVAAIGYVLFIVVTICCLVGHWFNIKETQALALQNLAITLSDDFRNPVRDTVNKFLTQNCQGMSSKEILYQLMRFATQGAKLSHMDNPKDSLPVDAMTLLLAIIDDTKHNS